MNRQSILGAAIALSVGLAIGYFGFSGDETSKTRATPIEKEIAYWVAPMDPGYRRQTPGKSPMGMDLIPVYKGDTAGRDVGFTIAPNIEANLGVKTGQAMIAPFAVNITATGRIEYDETRTARVHVRSEGWVEKLSVRAVGDVVKEGDLLFTLYSPVIASALSEYGQAKASPSTRLNDMALGRLKALGLDERTIRDASKAGDWATPINIYAPKSGVVTKLGVREGSLALKNTIAFEITDPSNMWLMADVFESQAPQVHVGQRVEIKTSRGPIHGVLDYIYTELDSKMQTVTVRINVPNRDGSVRAGNFYEVSIQPKPMAMLTIPTSAIIRLGDSNRVILSHGQGTYEAAEVIIGRSFNGKTVVKSGLMVGERVVISAQFMLDSESSFAGAALRLASPMDSDIDHDEMEGM